MSNRKNTRPASEDVVRRPIKTEDIPRHVSCDATIPPDVCDIPDIHFDHGDDDDEDSPGENSNSSHKIAKRVAQRLSQRAKQRARRLSVQVIALYDRVNRLHVHQDPDSKLCIFIEMCERYFLLVSSMEIYNVFIFKI
jgi:hypothetical protein